MLWCGELAVWHGLEVQIGSDRECRRERPPPSGGGQEGRRIGRRSGVSATRHMADRPLSSEVPP
ncbi:MAG: hypothetical protein JWR85_3846 [Marmoricola sp.]|jgi:hypothetical protein|nr:hypothetical protein [Marmoricola sp.]